MSHIQTDVNSPEEIKLEIWKLLITTAMSLKTSALNVCVSCSVMSDSF